jgi:DNA-binding MarR family transcriptional regulator
MTNCKSILKTIDAVRQECNGQLNLTELETLAILHAEKQDITYRDLARTLETTITTVSRVCRRLGQDYHEPKPGQWVDKGMGLIKAGPNPKNTREFSATLTKKGRMLMDRVCAF